MADDPLIARVVLDYCCSKCGDKPGGFGPYSFELRMHGKVYNEKAIMAAVRTVETKKGMMGVLAKEMTRRLYLEQAFLNIQRELTAVMEKTND